MLEFLMMPAIFATLDFLQIKIFKKKVMTPYFLSMTSPLKFYHVTQIIL